MTRFSFWPVGGAFGVALLLLSLGACGSSSSPPAKSGYALSAGVLSPASLTAGGSATSTITLTPMNGYAGSVSLSCSNISGGTPAPVCSFSASSVTIGGSGPSTSTLTVATTASTPGGTYSVTVKGSDANNVGPSNGSQALVLTAAAAIQHLVIIFQENRTPDNLFQDPVLISRGADIVNQGTNSSGQTIPLSQIDLGTSGTTPDNYDLSHAHSAFTAMCNANPSTGICAMTGADLVTVSCSKGATNCPPVNAQFMYVNPADVQPYFQMAEQYGFADRMFQTNQGPSFPAHQFILSGTSAPSVGSSYFVAENPTGVTGATTNTGCTAPSAEYVDQIDPSGVETEIYPCFEHSTLTDLLDAANLSWHYYAPSAGSIWTAPNAIQHMCGPNAAPPNATACVGADYTAQSPKVVLNQTQSNAQILTDISSNQLAAVSWVIPSGQFSDHAQSNTGCGPSWVTQVVNAVGNSPYWANTAIILTWDDWGGWYDHVPPSQMLNSYEYGFRVPLLVISPYAKTAYISHVNHDFGSILKFAETTFNLPSLGYADAVADDLSDFFDLTSPPVAFQAVTPPSDTAACIAANIAAADPDDD
jgi:phospholipase C